MGSKDKKVVIGTGSYQLPGGPVRDGFPLTKTNIARKPRGNEVRCMSCDGDGWDADWGGVFICPKCEGTGVQEDGICINCGHQRKYHYADSNCSHGYKYMHSRLYRLLHPREEYDINKYPCKCVRFKVETPSEE